MYNQPIANNKEKKMKFKFSLLYICVLVCILTFGCGRYEKPVSITELIDKPETINPDLDEEIPIIPAVADIEPGVYRMRVATTVRTRDKITSILWTIDDAEMCTVVELLLNPVPYLFAANDGFIFEPLEMGEETVYDSVVIEIFEKIGVNERQVPEHPSDEYPAEFCTVHSYEGRLIKNLSNPDLMILYDEEDE